MQYTIWRDALFGQFADPDPVMLKLQPEIDSLSCEEHLDHVDRALQDREIHTLYSREQIGTGLQLIYNSACSGIVFCYTEAGDEARRVRSILHLKSLYYNYFDRYCRFPVVNIGFNLDGGVGHICYMLWDIFFFRCPARKRIPGDGLGRSGSNAARHPNAQRQLYRVSDTWIRPLGRRHATS